MKIDREKFDTYGKHIFSVLIIALVIGVIFFAVKSAKVTMETDTIKVSGLYKINLKIDQIQELSLKEELPKGFHKTNGIDLFGKAYIGNFTAEGYDKIRTAIFSGKAPYIYITTKNQDIKYIIINLNDKAKTEELYNNINSKLK